jgi:hypothetical protein
MKKILFSVLCIAVVGLVSCTQKKNRITSDTLAIAIDPPSVSISTGAAQALKAICTVNGNSVTTVPVWSVDSSVTPAGVFSSANGQSIIFTAGPTACTGKIYATVSNVKAGVSFAIYGSTPASAGSIYSLYDSGVFNSDLANPGLAYYSGDTIGLATDLVNHSAFQTQSFEATFTLNDAVNSWADWAVSEKTPKNMIAYSYGYIRFNIRSSYDIQIGIRSSNISANTNTAKQYISQYGWSAASGASFQSVVIPVNDLVTAPAGTDLTQMVDMFIAAAVASRIGAQTNQSFWIDNIRWTTN